MISNYIYSTIGIAGWVALIVLPGCWITFGLTLKGFPVFYRVLTGIVLSPLVVFLQFYTLRLFGVSFGNTIFLLITINLPAVFLIFKQRHQISFPPKRVLLGGIAVLCIGTAFLFPQLLNSEARMFTGHAWIHADIIYSLSNGNLLLDDPELAGVRLAYPWAGHVYQGGLSFLLDSAPVSSYIWTNLVWLLCFYGFSGYLVAELGANRFTKMTAFIWLCLGINFIGFYLTQIVPESISERLWLGGDYRYSPWVLKFYFFEQIPLGLGMFAALLFALIKVKNEASQISYLLLIFFLLCGIGIVYPIIFVPAVVIVGAKILGGTLEKFSGTTAPLLDRRSLWLILVLFASALIALLHLKFLTVDRTSDSIHFLALSIDYAKNTVLKSIGSFAALSFFLVTFSLVFRQTWRINRNAVFILFAGGLGSLALNIFLEIPFWGNEYKFLFTAAICLSPFAALAFERLIGQSLGRRVIASTLALIILAAPLGYKINYDYPWRKYYKHSPTEQVPVPSVDASRFNLKLKVMSDLSMLCEAVRLKTSGDTILLAEQAELHLPTLTQRTLFAPPTQEEERGGVNMSSHDLLVNVRGYGKEIVNERRQVVKEIFQAGDGNRRSQLLQRVFSLDRPVAIILELPENAEFQEWLDKNGKYKNIYNSKTFTAWVIDPRESGLK